MLRSDQDNKEYKIYIWLSSANILHTRFLQQHQVRSNLFFLHPVTGDQDDDDDELMLNVLRCHLTYQGQVVTNTEARFNKIHIRKVYACLAVTCHLHFWQNDWDFLRATVVTRGWNGYRNKSQHRKLTLEKKILPPFQQGFEPATFQSRVRCSNHWAIPAPPEIRTAKRIIYRSLYIQKATKLQIK